MPDINTVVVTSTVSVVAVNSSVPGSYDSVARLSLGWFNVKESIYGATGNGTTDDTSAIQAAITACGAAGGGVVFFPPGNYKVTASLSVVSNGVVLLGSGRHATKLTWAGGASGMLLLGALATPIYRWKVSGLQFTDPTSAATYGAYLAYAREGVMEDVWFNLGFTNTALYLYGTVGDGNWTNRFERVVTSSCAGDGVYIGPQTNAVMFHGCHWTSCTGTHVVFGFGQGVSFVQCQFEQAGSGYEIACRGAASGNRLLGVAITDSYFELKTNTAGARALLLDETGGNAVTVEELSLEHCFIWGQTTATYLIESNVSTGGVRGTVRGCALFGAITAAVRCTTSHDFLTVQGYRALAGYGTGSTIPLLDTNSGAASGAQSVLYGTALVTASRQWAAQRLVGAGTAHATTDYALSAGWGNTAAVSAVTAKDTGGRITVASAGTGQAANPTISLTWKDGNWASAPGCVAVRCEHAAPATAAIEVTTASVSTLVLTFLGTPVAGTSYIVSFNAIGT